MIPVAAAQPPRQHLLDRVVQLKLPLARELEDDRRDERLRNAADPEPIARLRADASRNDRVPTREPDRPAAVAHEQHRARHPRRHQPVERFP